MHVNLQPHLKQKQHTAREVSIMAMSGIDISRYQKGINIAASGVQFAVMKDIKGYGTLLLCSARPFGATSLVSCLYIMR